MLNKAQDDELVMNLVDLALSRPPDQRETYLRNACGDDLELFEKTWTYVRWEERMNGFLLDPVLCGVSYEHTFEPGELLDGRFRIVREIAQGGMGVVYEAVDERLQRRIALKYAKIGFRKRLPPEVRNATDISHPNVCKIFEIHTASVSEHLLAIDPAERKWPNELHLDSRQQGLARGHGREGWIAGRSHSRAARDFAQNE